MISKEFTRCVPIGSEFDIQCQNHMYFIDVCVCLSLINVLYVQMSVNNVIDNYMNKYTMESVTGCW